MSFDYESALEYLSGHIDLEATAGWVHGLSLEPMAQLVELLGRPEQSYPVITITGTNGKGSTARMITALLAEHGLVVGTYASPHLSRYNERIARNGEPIEDDEFASAVHQVSLVEASLERPPSHFEILTAAAYSWFAEIAVDVAVIEVGLLGRYDATNVADATVAVVTNVGRDHTDFEGDWALRIAEEKAGIIKAQSHLVLGETDPDLASVFLGAEPAGAWQRDIDFLLSGDRPAVGGRQIDVVTPHGEITDIHVPVLGSHQARNASLAIAATEALFDRGLDNEVVEAAFAELTVPGRAEVMGTKPLVMIDGAHNPDGAEALAALFAEDIAQFGQRIVVIGLLTGRDPAAMLAAFGLDELDLIIATTADSPRALPADELARVAGDLGLEVEVAPTVTEALDRAFGIVDEDDMILVTGSLYVVGEARGLLEARNSR